MIKCNKDIHDELISLKQSICPFCNNLLIQGDKIVEKCCDKENIESVNEINVCLSCGQIRSCNFYNEYIDFHKNLYRIRRKSLYIRKYHIENILNSLVIKQGLVLTYHQRCQIQKVFNAIGTILNDINGERKRLISTKYIIYKILEIMDVPLDKIPITKTGKTLLCYEKYWRSIMTLIGDKIYFILL